MQSANCAPASRLKDRNEYKWKLFDITWNAVIHQDNKTSPKWETIRVATHVLSTMLLALSHIN